MEGALALAENDSIRIFPTITLPIPVKHDQPTQKKKPSSRSKLSQARYGKGSFNTHESGHDKELPGLLRTDPTLLQEKLMGMNPTSRSLVGFTASSLHLDTGAGVSPPPALSTGRSSLFSTSEGSRSLSIKNMNIQVLNDAIDEADEIRSGTDGGDTTSMQKGNTKSKSSKKKKKDGQTSNVENKTAEITQELRNYTSLMDKFSLHNFMIWNGKALKSTPEFQSYRRTYNNEWGGISIIIKALEEIMTNYEIKLAIVNGVKVFQLATLNLQFHDREYLLECIDNIEQIRPSLSSLREASKLNQQIRAAVLMQKLLRRYKAMKDYRIQKEQYDGATVIQSRARLYLHAKRAAENMRKRRTALTERWLGLRCKLAEKWKESSGSSSSRTGSGNQVGFKGKRLIIHIPSISASEYSRLNFDHIQSIQNASISCLYELADPDVVIMYVCPVPFGPAEIGYIHKFLAGLGIGSITQRLHFVVPELIQRLNSTMTVASILWYSAGALRKLRRMTRTIPNCVIIPSAATWVEQRIAVYLDVPMISIDPQIAEQVSSRSQARREFMEAKVNVSVGAHDVFSLEDFFISLSRLIASNLDVQRWKIRLNHDFNNDSVAVVASSQLSVVHALRKEMNHLITMNQGNPGAWYSRPVQISARRRLISCLQQEFVSKVVILRNDKYPTWSVYLRFLQEYGATVEAEQPQVLGRVSGLSFVDPNGNISLAPSGGVDVISNEKCQDFASIFPQCSTSASALEGATTRVVSHLYEKYKAIGHITVTFTSFWDQYENMPKLWAESISFGMEPIYGAIGILHAADRKNEIRGDGFFIPGPEMAKRMKSMVHIPLAYHPPLRSGRDDIFFKLCKMHGVVFDVNDTNGTLFPLLDSIVSGCLSMIICGKDRIKVLEICNQSVQFVLQQLGKDASLDDDEKDTYWENMTLIAKRLKFTLRVERKKSVETDKTISAESVDDFNASVSSRRKTAIVLQSSVDSLN